MSELTLLPKTTHTFTNLGEAAHDGKPSHDGRSGMSGPHLKADRPTSAAPFRRKAMRDIAGQQQNFM